MTSEFQKRVPKPHSGGDAMMLIAMGAAHLGWEIAMPRLPNDEDQIPGMFMGDHDYVMRLSDADSRTMRIATLPDDARGDGPCDDCGTFDNPVWFAASVLWNRVMGGEGGIVCPTCFIARAETALTERPTGWMLVPEYANEPG